LVDPILLQPGSWNDQTSLGMRDILVPLEVPLTRRRGTCISFISLADCLVSLCFLLVIWQDSPGAFSQLIHRGTLSLNIRTKYTFQNLY
jgi:hypothetical protein